MKDNEHLTHYEEFLHQTLRGYLTDKNAIDKILPDIPDIEGKWEEICMAYLNDGVREFNNYPTVSLGWMMFIGMAMAQYWDQDWEKYSKAGNIYEELRDARGYDNMDDYICFDVLGLDEEKAKQTSTLVADTAQMAYSTLMHEGFEPGTPEAFNAYVRALHQLYYFGAAVQLRRLGYHMTQVPLN